MVSGPCHPSHPYLHHVRAEGTRSRSRISEQMIPSAMASSCTCPVHLRPHRIGLTAACIRDPMLRPDATASSCSCLEHSHPPHAGLTAARIRYLTSRPDATASSCSCPVHLHPPRAGLAVAPIWYPTSKQQSPCSACSGLPYPGMPSSHIRSSQKTTPSAMASSYSRPLHLPPHHAGLILPRLQRWHPKKFGPRQGHPVPITSASCWMNNRTISGLTVNKVRCNAVEFFLSTAFTFAPCWINVFINSTFTQDDARCNGVELFASSAFTSAPRWINTFTASALAYSSAASALVLVFQSVKSLLGP